jgi:hypothetical protein
MSAKDQAMLLNLMETGIVLKQSIIRLEQLDKDTKWLSTNYNRLLKKFDTRFVGIMNQEIVAKDNNVNKLKEKLRAKGIKPSEILVELIRDKRNQIV